MKKSKSGLSAILAGIIGATAVAEPPTAKVTFQDPKVFPGQSSSYQLELNTGDEEPRPVKSIDFYDISLPIAVQRTSVDFLITGDYFGSGFFGGKLVDVENTVPIGDYSSNTGAVSMDASSQPFINNTNAPFIKYNFVVPNDTPPGVYNATIGSVNLNLFKGGVPPYTARLLEGDDIIPGSFEVVPYSWADRNQDGKVNSTDVDAFKACATRAGVPRTAQCAWADRDNDNDVDMDDFGKMQRCYSGQNNQYDANCGQ